MKRGWVTAAAVAAMLVIAPGLRAQDLPPPDQGEPVIPSVVTPQLKTTLAPYSLGPEGDDCEECGAAGGARCGWMGLFRTSKTCPRAIGPGEPLVGTSWLNRPMSVDLVMGMYIGDDLIEDRVRQEVAYMVGLRVGFDLDHYWGGEARVAWSFPEAGYPAYPGSLHGVDVMLGDVSMLYYPWGDSAWRPYALMGIGIAQFDFRDDDGIFRETSAIGMPVGGGIKMMQTPWLAFRAELVDNIAFSSGALHTMHNITFTLSLEMRFGGRPVSYYPWQPGHLIK